MQDKLQPVSHKLREFPPKSITKNTKKGKTILKPMVPIKFDNNKGKIETCLFTLVILSYNAIITKDTLNNMLYDIFYIRPFVIKILKVLSLELTIITRKI